MKAQCPTAYSLENHSLQQLKPDTRVD